MSVSERMRANPWYRRASRWYYRWPGDFYAVGPTTLRFTNERAVRAHLRDIYGLERLPRGTECWRAD